MKTLKEIDVWATGFCIVYKGHDLLLTLLTERYIQLQKHIQGLRQVGQQPVNKDQQDSLSKARNIVEVRVSPRF